MTQFLRNMSASQQVSALFIGIFGLLILVSMALLVHGLRVQRAANRPDSDPVRHEARVRELRDLGALLSNSWLMATVFWIGWALGDTQATILFGIVSFFILREFITLSPTRRGDHWSLVLAFFGVLPVQFWLVGSRHFDLFTVFIPVYVFLVLPVASALAGDTQRFLERNAKLQWGIMVCVYGMSHVPALLLLDFPRWQGKGAFLVFFLVFVVQAGMIAEHLVARRIAYTPSAPEISRSFSWRGLGVALLVAGLLGTLLSGITPFKPGQALAMSLIACTAGSLGHLVMKALKRDRGVTNWGAQGLSTTGATGLLDRVDGLCFAAPIFFHSVRWYFGL